jgi:hypothetical protein
MDRAAWRVTRRNNDQTLSLEMTYRNPERWQLYQDLTGIAQAGTDLVLDKRGSLPEWVGDFSVRRHV